jgi:menaquinone-9 beta-reductase
MGGLADVWERMDVEIAIIGAGLAGSAAAIELARAGRQVLLIEKLRFPRDKVCGGCLSGRAIAQLRRLLGPEHELPGVAGRQITFTMGAYRVACRPRGSTRLVLRSELDANLADAARAAGAEVRYGAKAALARGNGRWDVLVGDQRVAARTVLVASGLGGLATRLGIPARPQTRRMIAQQWVQPAAPALPPLGCVEMHWLRGGYVGLATPTPDCCVVALSADVPEHPAESAWTHLRALNPRAPLWSALTADAVRQHCAKGTAGFPWAPERLGDENVLLIGDAAGYEEPFSGEGMGQALCSGACAARAVLAGGDVLRTYTDLMTRYHRPALRRLRWIGRVLRSPVTHMLASGPVVLPHLLLAGILRWVHVKA